jgi:hypothetical protein
MNRRAGDDDGVGPPVVQRAPARLEARDGDDADVVGHGQQRADLVRVRPLVDGDERGDRVRHRKSPS